MNKRLLYPFILILLAFSIIACSSDSNDNGMMNSEQSFEATILEIDDTGILLEPLEGEDILRSGDRVMVGKGVLDEESFNHLEAGNIVLVTYAGGVMESYPLQLGEVISIEPAE